MNLCYPLFFSVYNITKTCPISQVCSSFLKYSYAIELSALFIFTIIINLPASRLYYTIHGFVRSKVLNGPIRGGAALRPRVAGIHRHQLNMRLIQCPSSISVTPGYINLAVDPRLQIPSESATGSTPVRR